MGKNEESIRADRWYHFSEYIIMDGVIQPTPTAKGPIPYDAWEQYLRLASPYSDKLPPYASLMAIVRKLKFEGQRVTFDQDVQRDILKWCNQYGLLGTLHHETVYAKLAPHHEKVLSAEKGTWKQDEYWLDGCSWNTGSAKCRKSDKAQVLVSLSGNVQKWLPLEAGWGRYFPGVPAKERATYRYPYPQSRKFWEMYAEPLVDFLLTAKQLDDAITTLVWAKGNKDIFQKADIIDRRPGKEESLLLPDTLPRLRVSLVDFQMGAVARPTKYERDVQKYDFVAEALADLEWMLGGASPSVSVDRTGHYVPSWRCRSLLSTLAHMALDDLLLGGTTLAVCSAHNCNRTFRSIKPNAKYCSTKCRKRAEVQRYRAQKRLASKGSRNKKKSK